MLKNCDAFMIYITGDTHGNQYKWVEQIGSVLSPADIILVCGADDTGLKKHFMIFLVNKSILCFS